MKDIFVFLKALAVFLGTVIGAGIFGLPFVTMKAGFVAVLIYFVLISLFVISIDWLYAKVALGTEKIYRLPGYVGQYLSPFWKKAVFLVVFLGISGSLLAYLIIGGHFLFATFSPLFGGSPALYSFLFFLPAAVLVFKDIKAIAEVELLLSGVLLIILFIFFKQIFPIIDINYFKTAGFEFVALPYGVILFSLWGSAVIPEIKEILSFRFKKDRLQKALKGLIIWGVASCSLIYLFFIFIIFGACGPNTTEDAISGLALLIKDNTIKLGFVFGVIACFTSFLTLSLTLKKMLWYDFNVPRNMAWLITCFLPLILFVLGLREFIEIIGFTGAVALGLEGIIVIFLYKEFLKDNFNKKVNPAFYLLALVFIVGIVFEIVDFFW